MSDFEFLHLINPRYTIAMYEGNEPVGKGHEHINGGFCERWECKWGGGETYKGEIVNCDFYINSKVSIHITSDSLWITDIRYSGKPDTWEFCVNHSGSPGLPCRNPRNIHLMEWDKLIGYLNTRIPECKLWDKVQAKAFEILDTTKVQVIN